VLASLRPAGRQTKPGSAPVCLQACLPLLISLQQSTKALVCKNALRSAAVAERADHALHALTRTTNEHEKEKFEDGKNRKRRTSRTELMLM
jgi:hypothetical protein